MGGRTRVGRATVESRPTITIVLPAGWARAVLSGVEAALLGWGLLVVAAVGTYWAQAANPWLADVTWRQAMTIGADAWALAHGAPVRAGAARIGLVPLLVPAILVVAVRGLLPRGRREAASGWFAVPSYAGTAWALAAASATDVVAWRVLPGAVAVAGLGAGWAVARQSARYPQWVGALGWLWSGMRHGLARLGALAAASGALLAASAAASWGRIVGIHELLGASGWDAVAVVGAQVLYLPTALGWAASWLTGAGFLVGTGALHSPTSAPTAPIPAVPALGAIPATAPGGAVVLVPVALGAAVGLLASRLGSALCFRDVARREAVAVAEFAMLAYAWMRLAGGSIGAHRLAVFGPRAGLAAALATAEVAVVAAAVALALHPEARAALRRARARVASWRAPRQVDEAAPNAGGAGSAPDPGGSSAGAEGAER